MAPLVPSFLAEHAELSLSLNLSDRVVDIVQEGLRLRGARGRPARLQPRQHPAGRQPPPVRGLARLPAAGRRARHPSELARHACLVLGSDASQTRGWAFRIDGELTHLRPTGRLDCTDGQVLHAWCLEGLRLAWRSAWEVEADLSAGRLLSVLDDFAAPPNGIYAVFPRSRHLPLRVRLWVEHLRAHYARPSYWL